MTPKKSKGIIPYLLIVVAAAACIYYASSKFSDNAAKKEYTEIIAHFDNYEVSYYDLDLGTGELTYQLRGEDGKKYKYNVPNVSIFLDDTENYRKEYNQKYPNEPLKQDYKKIKDNSWIYSLIPVLLMTVLAGIFIYFMMKQNGGGGKYSNFGKANMKNSANGRKATFKDVAGADEEKQELEEIVDFLKHPNKYKEIGEIGRAHV